MPKVGVGIDIGTSSIKALALTEDGEILTKLRQKTVPSKDDPVKAKISHDALGSWHSGVLEIWEGIKNNLAKNNSEGWENEITGVCVAAMVPSLTAVDEEGKPVSPGLLYGDRRGRAGPKPPLENEEFLNLLKWTREHYPKARGYWPAQTVANFALGGTAALDLFTAFNAMPLFSGDGWDEKICEEIGITPDQLPALAGPDEIIADMNGASLLAGTIDALSEMLVLPEQEEGDIIVIFGSTLICWAVTGNPAGQNDGEDPTEPSAGQPSTNEPPEGLWALPHQDGDKSLVGGPSNAGGIFTARVRELFGFSRDEAENQISRKTFGQGAFGEGASGEKREMPIWLPYIKGERTPLHSPDLKAGLYGLNLSHTNAEILRAAYEASGFVIRRHIEALKLQRQDFSPRRIIAAGGGIQSQCWMEAAADATNLAVETVAVPEGAALGAAWQACRNEKPAAGLNPIVRTIEPDLAWAEACDARYKKFLEIH